jgi:DNA-binding transcriptional MocR family regulator
MHDKARVAALQKAIEQERIEDLRQAERFRELAAKVRAFRDGHGQAPTEAELTEWAEHTAKAAAVAERLGELPSPPTKPSPPPPPPAPAPMAQPEFADSTIPTVMGFVDSQRSPQVEWMETFAYALLELGTEAGKGAGDIDQLMGLAARLWPQHGSRDPIDVAQQEFKKAGKD